MKTLSAAFAACFFCAGAAFAQPGAGDPRARAAFEPHPGDALPASLAFRDESGARVQLSDYYGAAPIVLVFAWYGCTTLCPTVVEILARTLERTAIAPGRGYQVIAVSIDPLDSPAAAMKMKQAHVTDVTTGDEARAWHLLTGTERSIGALARATGFRYGYDVNTHQYAHPTGIVLLSREGAIERYFPGLEFTPGELRDALHGSASQTTVSPADFVQLICFHVTAGGRYSAAILDALRLLTASALAAGFIAIFRVRRRGRTATKR